MSITQDKFDTGNRALDRFRRLIQVRYKPLLRAVTGNDKLEVEPHASGAFTDNKTVWIPVPLALGDETLEHDKSLCGQREPVSLKMLCPMCAVEDSTDGLVFHESAHITERSFDKMRRPAIKKMVDAVFGSEIQKLSSDQQDKIATKINGCGGDLMEVAGIVDTWMPFALNAVEDVYVNRRLFKYREGTEVPLRVQSREIFEDGISNASNGSLMHWKDNDKSAQAIISAYLIGHNLADLGSYLSPECDLTSDPKLIALMDKIPSECKVGARFEIAAELVIYLRTLGFCPPRAEDVILPPIPQPPSPSQGDPQPGQGEPGQEQGSGQQGPSDDTEDGDADGDADGSGESDDTEEGDDADGQGSGQSDDDDTEEGDDADGQGSGQSDDDDTEEGDDAGQGSDDDSDEADDEGEGASGSSADDDSGEADDEGEGGDAQDGGSDSDSKSPEELQAETDAEIEEQARRAKEMLTYVMGHDDKGPQAGNSSQDEFVLEQVLKQEGFDHPSHGLGGFQLKTGKEYSDKMRATRGTPREVKVPRNMLTPSLARLRVVFASNRKTGIERSLRSGPRLDTMHLYRAGTEDPRIFGRRNVPKSRDWFVCVGLDFSGSTMGNGADYATKMAAHAVGELLYELNVRFAMYAHSSALDAASGMDSLEHVAIKTPDQHWKAREVQDALFFQRGRGYNLDGHSLEQYRKVIERERATDKLMLYFTDGQMPNANFTEELEVLKENIEILRRQRVHLLGVGYRTDSPKRHGLETIQYNEPDDVASIVKGLELHLKS